MSDTARRQSRSAPSEESSEDLAADTKAVAPPQHLGWVLGALALSQLMIVLDGTVVNVALPTAQHDLGFGTDQRQWVVTAYALAFGGLLLLGGRLTDIWGRRTAFVAGLIGFAVASAVGGAAANFGMLVAGRTGQGAFAALLAPAALSLLSTTFTTPRERARAFGVFGAVAGGGAAIGLVLGGVLTEYTSWRWALFINLFFAAAAVVGALLWIPRDPVVRRRQRLDLSGAFTASLGLTGIVYGFSSAESRGWGDVLTIIALGSGVLFLAAFGVAESRVEQPLLPLRVLANRNRAGAYLTTGLVSLALFSVFLFLTYYLQALRSYTPLQTGLAFLPLPISIAITSIAIAPRLLPRLGAKVLLVIGPLVAAAALVLLTTISLTSSYWFTIVPALLVLGLGLGHVFSAAPNLATANLAPRDLGAGSAMVNTSQQVGGAIGTALLSAIAANAVTSYLHQHGTSAAAQPAAQLSSYHTAYLASAGILVLLAVTTFILLDSERATS